MAYISNDIVEEILLRLPVKSLSRFRCVRKSWYKFLMHNSDFIKKYLHHSIEKGNPTVVCASDPGGVFSIDNYQSLSKKVIQTYIDYPFKSECANVKILGSCNGLLFFILNNAERITGLWNPATREYKIIPTKETSTVSERHSYETPVRNYGLGYDRVSNEYKLVKITRSPNEEIMVSEVAVYIMSLNSWKRNRYIPYKISDGTLIKGVFVDEALHWLAKPCPIRSKNDFSQVLLGFNMSREVFYELPLAEIFNDNEKFEHIRIDVLGGFLCMLCSHSSVGFEVWVMNDYGVRDSWTKHYDVSRSEFGYGASAFRYLRRIQPLKNGVILFEIQLEVWMHLRATLVFYDPEQEKIWVPEIDVRDWKSSNTLPSMFHTETYVESLVSLSSGTYVGVEKKNKT